MSEPTAPESKPAPQSGPSPETRPSPGRSFLIADCGATNTTVALFDVVEGEHRLIARASAPTTTTPPWEGIMVGINQAIVRLSEISGRPLLTEDGELISPPEPSGAGVDIFGATISVAPPLQVLIAGLLEDVSVASARRAIQTVYAEEVDTFSMADDRDEQGQVQAILRHRPDIILLTGGTDGGDDSRLRTLAETVEMGVQLLPAGERPHVLFAGNRDMRPAFVSLLGSKTNTDVADNVRPSLDKEMLADAVRIIDKLYQELKIAAVPGIEDVVELSDYPPRATARAFATMIDYFAALYEGRVMGVDLGSGSVTLAMADAEGSKLYVRSNRGVGRALEQVWLEATRVEQLLRWLPYAHAAESVEAFVRDRALHPYSVPTAREELLIEQALVRHILRGVVQEAGESWSWPEGGRVAPPFQRLILRGRALTNTPRPGQTVLMALDALQPTGVFSVAIDRYSVIPALGMLAPHEPLAVVQILEGGALVEMGWVVAPSGRGEPGQNALRVVVESEEQDRLEMNVASGALEVLPLAPGVAARVRLEPERPFDVGAGPGRAREVDVSGGAAGLVIDARGRPLRLPRDDEARRDLVQEWRWALGG